jgi:hypothetical protein
MLDPENRMKVPACKRPAPFSASDRWITRIVWSDQPIARIERFARRRLIAA